MATTLLNDRDYLDNIFLPLLEQRLAARRELVLNRLNGMGVPFGLPDAGFFVFVDLSRWLRNLPQSSQSAPRDAEIELLEFLMDGKVFLEPGQVRGLCTSSQ